MSSKPQRIFREAAIDRLSSPDQLDQLVVVTRPIDWIAGAVIALALLILIAWGFLGRVPTRVGGDGIILGDGGKLAEAAPAVGGRLRSMEVAVGDRVAAGQPIARLAQEDIAERHLAALAILQQRDRELAELRASGDRETRAEDASDAARRSGFAQVAAAADARATVLARELRTTEDLVRQGLATQPDLDQMRLDLASSRQRAVEARNSALSLEAERLESRTKRAHDLLAAQFRLDDARREAAQLAALLARHSLVLSPIAGRVTEIRAFPGAVVANGAPLAVIETGQRRLQSVIYLPPATGKQVRPGMRVRVEPATIKREEFGVLVGRVESVSPFPATPEGMAATLHNSELAARFRRAGAPYAAVVRFEPDPRAPSGYRWSSGRGPAQTLSAGTLVHAEVVTRERRPVDLLLPLIRRVSGSDG
jgi:HlyD family secretion protein